MQKILLGLVVALAATGVNTDANAGTGWNNYTMNNIQSECIKKSQEHPPAKINSRDFGCGCFVSTISQKLDYSDFRKTGDHSKYLDYVVAEANAKCSSNYSFTKLGK